MLEREVYETASKNAQTARKNKGKLLQLLLLQASEIHSNQASLILPVVIKLWRHYYKLYVTKKTFMSIFTPYFQIKQNYESCNKLNQVKK